MEWTDAIALLYSVSISWSALFTRYRSVETIGIKKHLWSRQAASDTVGISDDGALKVAIYIFHRFRRNNVWSLLLEVDHPWELPRLLYQKPAYQTKNYILMLFRVCVLLRKY